MRLSLDTRFVRAAAAGTLVLLLVNGCSGDTAPPATDTRAPTIAPTTAGGGVMSPADFAAAAANGPWRPRPIAVPAGFLGGFENACVTAEPATGGLPVALRDVRGEGHVTVIFGEAGATASSYLCRGPSSASSAGDVEVVTLPVDEPPIADDEVDIARYELISDPNGDARTALTGRVGRAPVKVRATFPDVTEVEAARGGGWYTMWWPGSGGTNGVAAVDRQNVAIGMVAPEGPPAEP